MAEMSLFGTLGHLRCLELKGHTREEEDLEYQAACGPALPAKGSHCRF